MLHLLFSCTFWLHVSWNRERKQKEITQAKIVSDVTSPHGFNTWFYLWLFLDIDEVGAGATDELEEEPSASQMAGKSPNFCVLLHGSLKVEGMVAVVQLGWDNRAVYITLLIDLCLEVMQYYCVGVMFFILFPQKSNLI